MEDPTIARRSGPDHPTPWPDPEPGSFDAKARLEELRAFLLDVGAKFENMVDEQGPIPEYPPLRYDENAEQLLFSPEELKLRSEIFRRSMAVINAMDPDPPGGDEEFLRGIDSNRPEGRKLFEGYY